MVVASLFKLKPIYSLYKSSQKYISNKNKTESQQPLMR